MVKLEGGITGDRDDKEARLYLAKAGIKHPSFSIASSRGTDFVQARCGECGQALTSTVPQAEPLKGALDRMIAQHKRH